MLGREDNELLTRIGPGTPMGKVMREYWMPALLSSELPHPDTDPIRVMLLGEKLVAFRDSDGRVGLLPHNCPHRGASLFFGRVEEGGIRCVYHGWKYDVTGRCMDMPSEPAESDFKHKVRPRGYPCVERGGLVWAYMGTRAEPPPLPHFEAFDAPADEQTTQVALRECNWLQAVEGDLDTSHTGFLHAGHASADDVPKGSFFEYILRERNPRYKVVNTPFGATYGAYRKVNDDTTLWRIGHYLFPFYTMVTSGVLGVRVLTAAWVPLDDHHTMRIRFGTRQTRTNVAREGQRAGIVDRTPPAIPNGTGWWDRFRQVQNKDNEYLIDRGRQRRRESFTGIENIQTEDAAVTESMDPILDRTNEHLGTADMMVIRARLRLLGIARAHIANGTTPPGVDEPEVYMQRSGGVLLSKDADWLEATTDLRRAGVLHPELDPSIAGGI